ncbi:hypothetical protein, partial [Hafnia paralvei]|uniref:hypothetical protein n=1 Tax=Hafnia paralvei TaxID=546367 RepID=UPI001033AC4F
MEKTILGVQSVIDGDVSKKNNVSALPETQSIVPTTHSSEKAAPDLPSLGNDSISYSSENDPTAILAGNAMQAGQILSSDNVTNASIDYAKSIGEGLINQQINDWLNQ